VVNFTPRQITPATSSLQSTTDRRLERIHSLSLHCGEKSPVSAGSRTISPPSSDPNHHIKLSRVPHEQFQNYRRSSIMAITDAIFQASAALYTV